MRVFELILLVILCFVAGAIFVLGALKAHEQDQKEEKEAEKEEKKKQPKPDKRATEKEG